MGKAPALPPRLKSRSSSPPAGYSSRSRADTIHLTPEQTGHNHPYSYPQGLEDPRSSSTQSIRPVESAGASRRTLLLIYVHGFMGNETSFKSFPAHVHNILTATLADTHVVHTKIYPRYKSRRDVSFARDDFSNWLAPHESDSTDVIILGHSLGGILAAEVVILQSHNPNSNELFQHRILGLVAFDTPFLGLHPGVVSTGIASLFRPAPEIPAKTSPSSSGPVSDLFSPNVLDPNYNPSFPNDIHLANRKGKMDRAWYFWNKHCGELRKATKNYVSSHFEFGGCMADYPGMRRRYESVRALEDVDEYNETSLTGRRQLRRVRFVNYYSASTGRVKEREEALEQARETEMDMLEVQSATDTVSTGPPRSPRLSIQEYSDGEVVDKDFSEDDMVAMDPEPMASPGPSSRASLSPVMTATTNATETTNTTDLQLLESVSSIVPDIDNLPPIADLPEPPAEFDPSKYSSPDTLKVAKKEHDRVVKAYERTKKDREKSIQEREKLKQKLLEKHRKAIQKEQEKKQLKEEKEKIKRANTLNPETYDKNIALAAEEDGTTAEAKKKKRDRKFCALPKKDPRTGARDKTWIRVYMENMDEVVAHTSLFVMTDAYEKLVGDTAGRIESWVHEDATRRAVLSEIRDGAKQGW